LAVNHFVKEGVYGTTSTSTAYFVVVVPVNGKPELTGRTFPDPVLPFFRDFDFFLGTD